MMGTNDLKKRLVTMVLLDSKIYDQRCQSLPDEKLIKENRIF